MFACCCNDLPFYDWHESVWMSVPGTVDNSWCCSINTGLKKAVLYCNKKKLTDQKRWWNLERHSSALPAMMPKLQHTQRQTPLIHWPVLDPCPPPPPPDPTNPPPPSIRSPLSCRPSCGALCRNWREQLAHTPSVAFWHLPPNSARIGYATEGALFISAQLSTDAVSAFRKVWVLIWKQPSAQEPT